MIYYYVTHYIIAINNSANMNHFILNLLDKRNNDKFGSFPH